MFHKVKTITPLESFHLAVEFQNGERKRYDLNPLFVKWPPFELLKTLPAVFRQVRVDAHGYGIRWNEELDLSCEELWERGQPA